MDLVDMEALGEWYRGGETGRRKGERGTGREQVGEGSRTRERRGKGPLKDKGR